MSPYWGAAHCEAVDTVPRYLGGQGPLKRRLAREVILVPELLDARPSGAGGVAHPWCGSS